MAALTTSEIKIDGQILSCIPILVGQSNYSIWHVKIRNTLSAYGVWEIVEGTNTYASTIAADQEKWKLLDRRVLGLLWLDTPNISPTDLVVFLFFFTLSD